VNTFFLSFNVGMQSVVTYLNFYHYAAFCVVTEFEELFRADFTNVPRPTSVHVSDTTVSSAR